MKNASFLVMENHPNSMYEQNPKLDISFLKGLNNSESVQSLRKIQNENYLASNAKAFKVLKEFKEILKETDKLTSQYDIPKINPLHNENYNDTISSDLQSNDLVIEEDIVNKLKISNDVLIKANIDLKNKNRLLSHEINQYKNCAIYKNPFSQYDTNLNEFISNLKNSLEAAHQSNTELQAIIEKLQKSNEELSHSNTDLIHNFEICKNEHEKLLKENSEAKFAIDFKSNENVKLNTLIQQQNDRIANLDSTIQTKEKEINYLNTIITSNSQTQKENEEMINQLKIAISNLQKINKGNNSSIQQLNEKIKKLEMEIEKKRIIIENNQKELIGKNDEINEINKKISELENILKQNKQNFKEQQDKILNEQFEKEQLKTKIESLSLFLSDREKTIQNLQNSIAFLTKSFDNDISSTNPDIKSKNDLDNIGKTEAVNQLINNLQTNIEDLKNKNLELQNEKKEYLKEIEDFQNIFEQKKNEYQLLYKKYMEQSNLIANLKKDFLSKRNDEVLNQLIKANEKITKKLNKIHQSQKDKMWPEIKQSKNEEPIHVHNIQEFNKSDQGKTYELSYSEEKRYIQSNDSIVLQKHLNEVMFKKDTLYTFSLTTTNSIIAFNLVSKEFSLIQFMDNTNSLFSSLLEKVNSPYFPQINAPNGLYIIIQNYLFFYDSSTKGINYIMKLVAPHEDCSLIQLGEGIFIISGNKTKICELVQLSATIRQILLPNVNIQRINSGICNFGYKYIYVFFGEKAENSIERLDIEGSEFKQWEMLNLSYNFEWANLSKFIIIRKEDFNVLILGGEDEKKQLNENVYLIDLYKNEVKEENILVKENVPYNIFSTQPLQIEKDLFCIFDRERNIHVFNKKLNFYNQFKLE